MPGGSIPAAERARLRARAPARSRTRRHVQNQHLSRRRTRALATRGQTLAMSGATTYSAPTYSPFPLLCPASTSLSSSFLPFAFVPAKSREKTCSKGGPWKTFGWRGCGGDYGTSRCWLWLQRRQLLWSCRLSGSRMTPRCNALPSCRFFWVRRSFCWGITADLGPVRRDRACICKALQREVCTRHVVKGSVQPGRGVRSIAACLDCWSQDDHRQRRSF